MKKLSTGPLLRSPVNLGMSSGAVKLSVRQNVVRICFKIAFYFGTVRRKSYQGPRHLKMATRARPFLPVKSRMQTTLDYLGIRLFIRIFKIQLHSPNCNREYPFQREEFVQLNFYPGMKRCLETWRQHGQSHQAVAKAIDRQKRNTKVFYKTQHVFDEYSMKSLSCGYCCEWPPLQVPIGSFSPTVLHQERYKIKID